MQSSNIGLGRYGEEVAARRLAESGLRILERNWRCVEGELDIVALEGETLAVCEVKTRSERGFQAPSEGIDQAKAERLRHLAERWLGERWPVHFEQLARLVQPEGLPDDRGAAPAATVAAEPGPPTPKKRRSARSKHAGAVDPELPGMPGAGGAGALGATHDIRQVPLPPGGVRIDLVAVVNRLKGPAQVEHLRGVV